MFLQIHMLQSMPPGNLNRDETGQPKKAIFGGVTRGRISSQCLKRNIRLSDEFKNAFGDALADRTLYLPKMVADVLRKDPSLGVPEDEFDALMAAIAKQFKSESKGKKGKSEEADDGNDSQGKADEISETEVGEGKTGQLVFFQQPFACRIAELVAEFRKSNRHTYDFFVSRVKKVAKDDKKKMDAQIRKTFTSLAFKASQTLTVDIGLFGRMTTSDLVANIEATCQVAHAMSTHEVVIEDDFWTAMDDKKKEFAKTQTEALGSGMGSFDERAKTFFNSAVYYKYFNLDLASLKDEEHLPGFDVAKVAEVFIKAAAFNNPTGKQNAFASHGMPEMILVELSKTKRPISYANAFLQPIEGGVGRNMMTESSKAFCLYVDKVALAFSPPDIQRLLLVAGHAEDSLKECAHEQVMGIDQLAKEVAVKIREAL